MSKYKLNGERRYDEDYILFTIENKVLTNDSVGDIRAVDEYQNLLLVLDCNFNIEEDRLIQEFILDYFRDPIQVYNQIFGITKLKRKINADN